MIAGLHQLRFASDATHAALWGGGLLVLAGLALWAETRRVRRRDPDRVGWMPWTAIFLLAALAGLTLLAMAVRGWNTPAA